jgi:hypothetical protein
MMDLSTVDPALIVARGEYATVNGAYKDTMESMQKQAQKACDLIRLSLQDETNRKNHIVQAEMIVGMLVTMAEKADELLAQKNALYPPAWGA